MPSCDTSRLLATPICDLQLAIKGSLIEALIAAFMEELKQAGIIRLKPHFYLSTEWGVPFGSISVSIPFYLTRSELIRLHVEQAGFLEGAGRGDFLRYLRHEMGHVVNYAYRLYDRADWTACFGSMKEDYVEEYSPHPFSRKYVCHLPGWYAQKHPDEDWAESFAVWMTPDSDWRSQYAAWPETLEKLKFCDQLMNEINKHHPLVTLVDTEEEVSELKYTLRQYYDTVFNADEKLSSDAASNENLSLDPVYDVALYAYFEDIGELEDISSTSPRLPAGALIRRMENDLVTNVYRWTGCFPSRVRPLVQQLARRADQLDQVYPADHELSAILAISSLVSALAMDRVVRRGQRKQSQQLSQGALVPATE